MLGKGELFERLLASAATVAAIVGCATMATVSGAPQLAIGGPHAPVHTAPLSVTGAAYRSPHADVLRACSIEGSPRVVAAKAAPPAGVEADADSDQVRLRFSEKFNGRVVMALNPQSLEVVAARDSLQWWADEGAPTREPIIPVIARIDSSRSVLAWTQGSLDTGLDVRVLTVDSDGQPLGSPVALPHEGSAIGRPAVAITSSGRGVVAFLDSNGHGFQLVAASLDCTPKAEPDTPSSWASRSAP